MAKKTGIGTLLTGLALGAAALFLSKKENRVKAKKVVAATVTKAKKLKADYKKAPAKTTAKVKAAVKTAVKKQVNTTGKKIAKKAVAVAKKKVRKLVR